MESLAIVRPGLWPGWESGSEADTGESPREKKRALQAESSKKISGLEYFKILILTSVVGLLQSVEIDQRPDKKFKQSLFGLIWLHEGIKTDM